MGDLQVIDADGHVMEPHDLWDTYLDQEFLGVAPVCDPERYGLIEVLGRRMSRRQESDGVAEQVNRQFREKHPDAAEHGFDAASQLRAMDEMGIDRMVLFPSLGLFVTAVAEMDGRIASAYSRAYNRWLHDFCATDPRRLIGVGLAALHDPGLAVGDARYAVEDLGMRGVMVRPNPYHGRNLDDPAYDDFYATVAGLGVPLAVHEGCGVWMPEYGVDRFSDPVAWHAMSHPMEQMGAVLSFTMGGVMERHPQLRVGFLEAGAGWLPFWLHRLDEHVDDAGGPDARELSLLPSEYFQRQGWIGFEVDEPLLPEIIEVIGADRLLWASDYPHPDGRREALGEFIDSDRLASGPKQQILEDNPARFYALQ